MTSRPILFSGPMTRALLEGRKTQTRRVVKGIDPGDRLRRSVFANGGLETTHGRVVKIAYEPGDLLWVRETCNGNSSSTLRYRATDGEEMHWRPSIHMPRWASRLTLRITAIRAQRLQEISKDDAMAEGVEREPDAWVDYQYPGTRITLSSTQSFQTLWDSLNAKRGYSWEANPWVWALTFDVIAQNVDVVAP